MTTMRSVTYEYLVLELVSFTLCAVKTSQVHPQFVVEDKQLFHSFPDGTAGLH